MPGTLRIARRWCITMVQVCLRVLERPAAWPMFSPGSRAGPRCIEWQKHTWGESEQFHQQFHPLNTRVLRSVSGFRICTNIFLESIHSTLQDIQFAALFALPSLPTECSSAYSSKTRVNSGLSWKMRTDIYSSCICSCTILLDSTGESVNGRVGRVPSDFIWFPPPKGSTEMGSFAPAPAFSESQKAQLVCTK